MDVPVTEDQIRTLAFYLWENDGGPEGPSEEHWEKARQQLGLDAGAPSTETSGQEQPRLIGTIAAGKVSRQSIARVSPCGNNVSFAGLGTPPAPIVRLPPLWTCLNPVSYQAGQVSSAVSPDSPRRGRPPSSS
jgi:hypothetical protein